MDSSSVKGSEALYKGKSDNVNLCNPSELDWFTFETKIRKVIAELLEPNIKR